MSSILEDGKHARRRESLPGGRAGENVAYLQHPPKMRVKMLAHSEMAARVRPRRPWFAVRRLIAGEEKDGGGDREDDEGKAWMVASWRPVEDTLLVRPSQPSPVTQSQSTPSRYVTRRRRVLPVDRAQSLRSQSNLCAIALSSMIGVSSTIFKGEGIPNRLQEHRGS